MVLTGWALEARIVASDPVAILLWATGGHFCSDSKKVGDSIYPLALRLARKTRRPAITKPNSEAPAHPVQAYQAESIKIPVAR